MRASANPEFFADDIAHFAVTDRDHPPPERPIVFVGSSSIRFWGTLQKIMAGRCRVAEPRFFGGAQLSHVIQFVDRTVIQYRPRAVVLYAGDNDLDKPNRKEPREDVAARLPDVRCPACRRPCLMSASTTYRSNPRACDGLIGPDSRKPMRKFRHFVRAIRGLGYIDVATSMLRLGSRRHAIFSALTACIFQQRAMHCGLASSDHASKRISENLAHRESNVVRQPSPVHLATNSDSNAFNDKSTDAAGCSSVIPSPRASDERRTPLGVALSWACEAANAASPSSPVPAAFKANNRTPPASTAHSACDAQGLVPSFSPSSNKPKHRKKKGGKKKKKGGKRKKKKEKKKRKKRKGFPQRAPPPLRHRMAECAVLAGGVRLLALKAAVLADDGEMRHWLASHAQESAYPSGVRRFHQNAARRWE